MGRLRKPKPVAKLLETVLLSLTDQISYFPCLVGQPNVVHPDFSWWRFKIHRTEECTNTLYLPVADKTYKEIGENLYFALTERRVDLFSLNNADRRSLYENIVLNPSYSLIRHRRYSEQLPQGL